VSQVDRTKVSRLCAIIASMRFFPDHPTGVALAVILWLVPAMACAQTMPATSGETLGGKRLVLADAIRGHASVLIFGFSKDAGDPCGQWAKALRADPAMAGILVYQVASLEQAPGFVRGMIKSSMRKGMSTEDQDHFLIFTQDEKLWRSYFGVSNDKDPWVAFLDATGKVLWHGHGDAKTLEPLLNQAKP
jgi:hypothetical protein